MAGLATDRQPPVPAGSPSPTGPPATPAASPRVRRRPASPSTTWRSARAADVVVSCTGSTGTSSTPPDGPPAVSSRPPPSSTSPCRTTSTGACRPAGRLAGRPRRAGRRAARLRRRPRGLAGPPDRVPARSRRSSPPAASPASPPPWSPSGRWPPAVVDAEMERLEAACPTSTATRAGSGTRAPGRRQAAAPADRPGQGLANETGAVSYADALARALRPRPRTPSTRSPARRRRTRHQRPASAPAAALATTQSGPGRRPAVRELTGTARSTLGQITTDGDLSQAAGTRSPGSPDDRCLRLGAARRAAVGRVDVAVHSLKDLPTYPPGITLAAVPRARTRVHVVVARDGFTLGELRPAAGSAPARRAGSPRSRRSASASNLKGVRGNVDTRIGKVRPVSTTPSSRPRRPGPARPARRATEVLDPLQVLPAPAKVPRPWSAAAATPGDPGPARPARRPGRRAAVTAERTVLARLGAAAAPIGALAEAGRGRGRPRSGCAHRGPPTAPCRSPARPPPRGCPATWPTRRLVGVGDSLAEEMLGTAPQTSSLPSLPGTTAHPSADLQRLQRMTRATTANQAPVPGPHPRPGGVAFVGTGPGDPDLLTGARRGPAHRGRTSSSPRTPVTPTWSGWCARHRGRRRDDRRRTSTAASGEDGQPLTHAARAKVVV